MEWGIIDRWGWDSMYKKYHSHSDSLCSGCPRLMENTVSLCSFGLGLGDDGRMFSRLVRIPSIHDLAYPDVGRYADNGGDNDVLYEFNGGVGGQEDVWLG